MHFLTHVEERHDALLFSGGSGEVFLGLDERLAMLLGECQSFDELVFGEFPGLALNHDDLVLGAREPRGPAC